MDLLFFRVLHNVVGKNVLTDRIIIFFAHDLIFLLALFLCVPSVWRKALPRGIMSAGLAYATNALLGIIFFRSRPFVTLHFTPLVHAAGKSFPSDHTAVACAIATTLFFIDRPLGYGAWIVALLIGASRVSAGVHYPLDILGGIVVGTLSGYLISRIFHRQENILG